jgi:hypothetical protein
VLKTEHTAEGKSEKYLESFEMRCWSRKEISWTDSVRNEVLHRVKEESIHNLLLYLAYPDVLSLVKELLSEDDWGSSNRI